MALAEVPSALGPIWTDSLDMEALASYGDLQARARAALVAGSDLLVVGMDAAGGIAVAQKLEAPVSPRLARWMEGPAPGPIPKAWPMEGIVKTAGAGVRILQDADLPEGEWEWILPRRLGPYGEVAGPPADVGRGPAARRIARVTRYDAQDPASLKRALTSGTDVFALVGWIHRGWPDPATGEMIQEAGGRVRAIAHLLDGPDGAMIPGIWECETCGFGEGEIAVLQGLWQGGRSSGLRR
jgi:hypothetical protein